jgi:hypothetical protein
MDCIDFSTNQVMRPFGAAKAKAIRAAITPRDTRAKIKAQPPKGGVKLIPRVSPITPTIVTNPYTDRIPRASPATAPQKSNPRGLRFF